MLVSIILPTIRTATVGDTIESVLRQTDDNWQLIVVPQGDDADLIALLERYRARDPRISYVHTDTKNASHARNVGMEAVRGEIIAFTDDDCEVAPDWVSVIRDVFTTHPEIGYLGGEVVAPPSAQPWRISTCPAAHVIDATFFPSRDGGRAPEGFYMIGANICARTDVARRTGPFDVVLGAGARFACCEDQDWGFRAAALDVGFMTTKRLVVNHTTGRRYGVRAFVKHQRNYAWGRGAWVAKLQAWGHPMGDVWSRPPTIAEHLRMAVTRPHKWLLERFGAYHQKRAAAVYRAEYEVGPDVLSHPRQRPVEAQAAPPPVHAG
jgi:glycosyltransferase involved in cell wall biosynthesis